MSDISAKAAAAIGTDDPGADWKLDPTRHAAGLPAEAGALRRILERDDLKSIIDRFRAADERAVAAQEAYKSLGRNSLYAGMIATLFGAAFIVLPAQQWDNQTLCSVIIFTQFAFLSMSLITSIVLSYRNPFDIWMKARAEAELARVELFDTVMAAEEPRRDNELPLLPLKLEYFRRYQLETQQRYYAGRGAEHFRSAGHSRGTIGTTYLLAGLATTVAVIAFITAFPGLIAYLPAWAASFIQDWLLPRADWTNRISLAAGIVASTVFAASISRSLMDLDERNASRYLTNADNLLFLRETLLEPARSAAATDRPDDVFGFVARVHSLISSEHKEWALLREAMPIRNPKHYFR